MIKTRFKAAKLPLLAVPLILFSFLCAGCPALAVPSLIYQGYKYEKKHDKPEQAHFEQAYFEQAQFSPEQRR